MKKLTAGIFTVMLGLCATSGADAAVASKDYVDTKVGANTQSITELTQTVAGNKSAAETAIADAKKAGTDAAAALETYKTDNNAAVALKANSADVYTKSEVYTKTEAETKFMDSTEVSTAITNAVTGENGALKDYAKVTDLNATNQNVTANTNAISAINNEQTGILALAKADATSKANAAQSAAEATAASALSAYQTTNDAAVEAAKSAADAAKATADGAVSVNESQATAISANTTAIETLNGGEDVTGSVAKKIADAFTEANLSKYATTEAMNLALTDYELKSNLKALARKDTVGTDDIDNLAVTTGKLANGAVTADKLGANAVTNAAVADGALSQGKIDGLDTTLATKMTITSATTEAGKYVFTANVADNGVTDYAWELIAREGE